MVTTKVRGGGEVRESGESRGMSSKRDGWVDGEWWHMMGIGRVADIGIGRVAKIARPTESVRETEMGIGFGYL
ncbi:hypothetical protein TSUD_145880 [Trifolium subterraneum]|jgi:hypothetical protein|uniref:Uncharacterized protein n=1 Tax=Trifolium subterraneum TaxID=3900 RepID=A0A2Z6N808_TRISU|nr:hypothetical protein TSUD_145880 [Trifolium subterraneum]